MREYEDEIRQAGATIAAVGLGGQQYAAAFREEFGFAFPLLVDEDRKAYQAVELKVGSVLGAFRPMNLAAARRAKASGHRLGRVGKNPLQLGGTFVFGPGNQDRYAHVNQTYSDFVSPQEVLRALR